MTVMISLKGPVPILFWAMTLNWYSVAGSRLVTNRLFSVERSEKDNHSCFSSVLLADTCLYLEKDEVLFEEGFKIRVMETGMNHPLKNSDTSN